MSLSLAPNEQVTVKARLMPSGAAVLAAILCPLMFMLEEMGAMLGLIMIAFVFFGVAGRWVYVTNQRIVVTKLFGKREKLVSKVESIETKGIAALALVFYVQGTGSGGLKFIPRRDPAALEGALRSAIENRQAR